MEENLLKILSGKDLGPITTELCDFSLDEQNAVNDAQGIPSTALDFTPIVGKSITYIVACVLFNELNEILMMQEAKESCAGKWYLPAGRMEKNETIVEAGVREVYEETGLNVELTTLLAVEVAGGSWFRFVLTGHVIGGELKTPSNADKESLQAKWIYNVNELHLRSNDILNLIDLTKNYYKQNLTPYYNPTLPIQFSHNKNYLRVVACIRKRSSNTLNMLLSEKNEHHFPTVEINPNRSIHSTLKKFMIEIFGADFLPQHRPHSILSIEHKPILNSITTTTTDGICVTILVVFRPPLENVSIIGKCIWHEISMKNLDEKINSMLTKKEAVIQLHVIR